MKNPFTAHERFESKPPRNSFDCSKRVYMTGKVGCLYPHVLAEVNAGDSVQIDVASLFNLFPMVFPIQTPMRQSVYIFYDRNRNCWKNWKDFAYNNKQPEHPFILQPQGAFWKTGELADYLGVPTTLTTLPDTQTFNVLRVPVSIPGKPEFPKSNRSFFGGLSPVGTTGGIYFLFNYNFNVVSTIYPQYDDVGLGYYWLLTWDFLYTSENLDFELQLDDLPNNWDSVLATGDRTSSAYWLVYCVSEDPTIDGILFGTGYFGNAVFSKFTPSSVKLFNASGDGFFDVLARDYIAYHPDVRFRVVLALSQSQAVDFYPQVVDDPQPLIPGMPAFTVSVEGPSVSETKDLSQIGSNPFAGTVNNPPAIPLNAIPFRVYERIYNSFFRNERNDPFMVNGEPEYNKYCTTDDDGADSTQYKLQYRNWESDFLTSATQTPQQGIAPLIGVNVRGDMSFQNDDGTVSVLRPEIAGDGNTITGIKGFLTNPNPEAMRSAIELVTSGIAINDIRNVGSFQSWLENNIRRGFKYPDQVLANTGVKVGYDELDMPEFLGGFSRPVTVTSITQATPSTASDNALGDRAGQASVFGGSKHTIKKFCDEAGYIMAITVLYPEPVYTQLLPKYFLKKDCLSYYHPVFGDIGLQPITYKEVCPIQVFQQSGDLNATFGYQRPWYDLISSVDEAHGNMRTNMRDYLMHRTFNSIPRLGAKFLKVDPKQLNDVFAITDDTEDVYQGQYYFQVYIKRAIPRYGIPRKI